MALSSNHRIWNISRNKKKLFPLFSLIFQKFSFIKEIVFKYKKNPNQQNQNKTRGKLKQVKIPVFFLPPKVKQNKNLKHNKPTKKKKNQFFKNWNTKTTILCYRLEGTMYHEWVCNVSFILWLCSPAQTSLIVGEWQLPHLCCHLRLQYRRPNAERLHWGGQNYVRHKSF